MKLVETKTAEGLLALTALRGIGPATAERLAGQYSALDAILDEDLENLKSVVSSSIAETLHTPSELYLAKEKARRILDKACHQDVRVLSVFDEDYPVALKGLRNRPPFLFIKGKLPPARSVACIGTREPSEFGSFVCQRLVETLVSADWAIVSGLALGIDTLSHQEALRCNGRTIAVMAGGLDAIYPKQNAKLADEILASDGALISEHPFGVPASARNLVQRDRLQSGLSVATFVIQTDIKGGSMHTVRFTIQQKRLLFAPVPQGRHASEPKSRGVLAMTSNDGPRFADVVRAEGEYRRILFDQFRDQSIAIPLASKQDYSTMLESLETRLGQSEFDSLPEATPNQLSMF